MMPVADHQEKRDSMAQQRVCSTHLEIPKQKQCAKGSCSICLESLFLPNQQIGYLSPCGHCFHLNCIQEWKAQTAGDRRASRCPLCDKRIEHCGKVFLQIDEYDKNEEEEKSFHQAEDVELPCSSSNGELAESERRTTELIAKVSTAVSFEGRFFFFRQSACTSLLDQFFIVLMGVSPNLLFP